jgi:hypothetical protein
MDIKLLRIFQRQVLLQCRFLLYAAGDVTNSLGGTDRYYTFYALQNMLNAGANISKSLWGGKGKFEIERARKPLRDSIGITDDSPLREVKMRNNFEHYDERLEKWWKTTTNRNYADLSILSVSGGPIRHGLISETDRFREYDPVTTELVFWGQKFNLNDLVQEVSKIMPKLEVEVQKPY